MSDPRDRSILGTARAPGVLNGSYRQASSNGSSSTGLVGPPRGRLIVAQAPKGSKAARKPTAPEVKARELTVYGSYENPWNSQADEIQAMKENRWSPTSDDFRAVAGPSSMKVDSWAGILQVMLVNGDAASQEGSINRLNIFTHANTDLIALSGTINPRADEVMLRINTAISEETLEQLDGGSFYNVVSKNKALREKRFFLNDVRKRFTKDAVIVIYACHAAVNKAFVQHIANTFQVKVRAFSEVIGYFPNYDDADPATGKSARVTNRRTMGVGYNAKTKVNDFHQLDTNASDRSPKPDSNPAKNDDDDE